MTVPPAPRELVLASAGSGKTFHLSSRILGLLAAGVPPGELLASTFTRKAAGEILERTLLRLARAVAEEAGIEELNVHARLIGTPPLDRERAEILLLTLCGELHRLQVGTLDSFFHRVARAFSLELGLAPGWGVADEAEAERLLEEAVERLLDRVGEVALIELLRMLSPGEVRRGVHGEILETVRALQSAVRELDPAAESPWGFETPPPEAPSKREIAALLDRLHRLEPPLTAGGKPRVAWERARDRLAALIEAGEWEEVGGQTLVQAALPGGTGTYSGVPLPHEWHGEMEHVLLAVRASLLPKYHRQMEARGRLAEEFEEAYRAVADRRGLFRFADVPHLLIEGGELGSGDALFYRLDGRIRHLLLDEFQDTSTVQWRALEPLAGEILAGTDPGRAGVIVADPKQSIYGWRGAEPGLIPQLEGRYALPRATLAKSWRTGAPILEAVNRIFERAEGSEAVSDEQRTVLREWMDSFSEHRPAREDRPGYVRVVAAPEENHGRGLRPGLLRAAASEVERIREAAPGASVGVLCRTRSVLVHTVFELRRRGIPVSEEGGSPLGDAWGVHLMLAALRFSDGVSDRVSRYLLQFSPMGAVLGLDGRGGDAEAYRLSARIRAELLERGYGEVLDRWSRELGPLLPARDRARIERLVELAFRFDAAGGAIRPIEFVRRALAVRVETPGEAPVRVMTVHASKGLEFDAVVLPDLERPFTGRGGRNRIDALPLRSGPDGGITRILPRVRSGLEPLFPELREAAAAARAASFRDELSLLYVALTRPRHALHIVMEVGKETRHTPAAMVRHGLALPAPGPVPAGDEAVLLGEFGDPEWMGKVPGAEVRGLDPAPRTTAGEAIGFGRRSPPRVLLHTTPSQLAGGNVRSVVELLRPPPEEAFRWGSLVHAWLEEIEWLDPEVGASDPELEARLVSVAQRVEPGWEPGRSGLPRFLDRLEAEPLRSLLRRDSFPPGTRVERELRFLSRQGTRLVSGSVDRLLLFPGALGGFESARVLDFKTDLLDQAEVQAAAERYQPQLEAYRIAVAERFRIPPERVGATLVFLEPGALAES